MCRFLIKRHRPAFFGRRKIAHADKPCYRFSKKPDWVKKEIIRMKAMMPQAGCRQIANCFNRHYTKAKNMTVGKTWVGNVIRGNQYEIQVLRKNIKHRIPKPIPKNLVWGLDLTGKTDTQNKTHNILDIVEHASRGSLCLTALKDKTTITLLRHLLDAIEQYGKPRFIRTDNEGCFTSRLFCSGLWLLDIKHQRIDMGCPWQNGRVERFFGSLKEKLSHWEVDSLEQLNGTLEQFQVWYNHVRPHQHMDGRTPAEVWQGTNIYTQHIKKEYWFEAWDGLLTGYYLRL